MLIAHCSLLMSMVQEERQYSHLLRKELGRSIKMIRKEKYISEIRSEVEALIGVQAVNKIEDISETTSAYHNIKEKATMKH